MEFTIPDRSRRYANFLLNQRVDQGVGVDEGDRVRPDGPGFLFARLVCTIGNNASADKCFCSGLTMAAPGFLARK